MTPRFYQTIEHIVPQLKSSDYIPGENMNTIVRKLREIQDYYPEVKLILLVIERFSLLDNHTLDMLVDYYESNDLMEYK